MWRAVIQSPVDRGVAGSTLTNTDRVRGLPEAVHRPTGVAPNESEAAVVPKGTVSDVPSAVEACRSCDAGYKGACMKARRRGLCG